MTILDAPLQGVAANGTETAIALVEKYAAHNYSPLPVAAARAEGAWITDVEGRRYLDCLAAYSAVNFGHRNPEITATAHAQLDTVTLVSRAFHSDNLGPFCAALAQLCGKDMVLPMNSGAEAVESGLKVARKWGAEVKGVPEGCANIIVADNNFHGRTISIVSFSSDPTARDGFGPFTPGFRSVPFGDAGALAHAIDDNTVAVLLEPIQGEAGIIVPPDDYLPAVRALCNEHNVLMIADEIQSGLARTGYTFACDRWVSCPMSTCWGRRWEVAWFRCRRWSQTAKSSAFCIPASTARRSAATHWPLRSGPRWFPCWRRGTFRRALPNWVLTCIGVWGS
jgi:ornithine--oxo-acid transaminase